MPTIFDPVTIGDLTLPNRIAMAPMTRARSDDSGEPGDIMVDYYAQRASAGLIVSEGIFPSIEGKGYYDTPGIETEAQTTGWKRVTDAVHDRGGRIFLQLMHCGRVGHPLNNPGVDSVAPSAVQADFQILTREGLQRMGMPRALSTEEVGTVLDRFERAAENSKAAGFDGIELHAASGYLPNQFLASNTNQRDDIYGGTPQKRCRFVIEATERLAKVFGPQRTAVKLAPRITYNDIADETVDETYGHLLGVLDRMGLAYLHFQTTLSYVNLGRPVTLDGLGADIDMAEVFPYRFMRERFSGPIMAAGDLTVGLANQALETGLADLFAFGRGFVGNPDLPERMRIGAPLTPPDLGSFYGGGAKGLTDWPVYTAARSSGGA